MCFWFWWGFGGWEKGEIWFVASFLRKKIVSEIIESRPIKTNDLNWKEIISRGPLGAKIL